MSDIERLCDRVLVVDHGRLAFDGTLPALAGTVGAERVLVVDLAEPAALDVPGARLIGTEGGGLRQRWAFTSSAATVLASVAQQAEIRDLTIDEPDIEDVVRRLYLAGGGREAP
jgi:ABC-2 type transport system ATP-binding protein